MVMSRGMAWWTDIFLKNFFEESQKEKNEENIFASLIRAIKSIFYDNFVDTLYKVLLVSTYAYLVLSIAAFFFQRDLPRQIGYLVDAFSEPYLGALGMYVIVTEIRRRRGKVAHHHLHNVFVGAWSVFLIAATLVVYFGDTYYFDALYRTVVTNSLAAMIIRIGGILSRVP